MWVQALPHLFAFKPAFNVIEISNNENPPVQQAGTGRQHAFKNLEDTEMQNNKLGYKVPGKYRRVMRFEVHKMYTLPAMAQTKVLFMQEQRLPMTILVRHESPRKQAKVHSGAQWMVNSWFCTDAVSLLKFVGSEPPRSACFQMFCQLNSVAVNRIVVLWL